MVSAVACKDTVPYLTFDKKQETLVVSEENKRSIWPDKPIPELLWYLANQGEVGSRAHEEVKGAINAALTKQLCESIDRHERASSCLSKQILWLNFILGAFTIAGTVLAIISLLK